MIPDARAAGAVLDALAGFGGPIVLDPVLAASSGGGLYLGDRGALLALAARATLVTPNAVEAAALAGRAPVTTAEAAAECGRALVALGARAVLVKGGHVDGPVAVDVLVTPDGTRTFTAERLPGPSVRGTGCALATAIAVGLARGLPLGAAIAEAKAWLHAAIQSAVTVGVERHLS